MNLTSAVAELRKKLGDTQEAFAARLNYSVRTVAWYESDRPPKGLALWKFAMLAHGHGLDDLAKLFVEALNSEWGEDVLSFDEEGFLWLTPLGFRDLTFEAKTWKPLHAERPRDKGEYLWVNALLAVLRSDTHAQLRGKVLSVLRGPAKQWLEELHDGLALDSEAVEKLLRKGKSPAEVADLLDLDVSEVERFWQWIQLSEAFEASSQPRPRRKRR